MTVHVTGTTGVSMPNDGITRRSGAPSRAMGGGRDGGVGVAVGGDGVRMAVGMETGLRMKGMGSGDAVGLGVLENVGNGRSVGVC